MRSIIGGTSIVFDCLLAVAQRLISLGSKTLNKGIRDIGSLEFCQGVWVVAAIKSHVTCQVWKERFLLWDAAFIQDGFCFFDEF